MELLGWVVGCGGEGSGRDDKMVSNLGNEERERWRERERENRGKERDERECLWAFASARRERCSEGSYL
jgi:hypothetical protein